MLLQLSHFSPLLSSIQFPHSFQHSSLNSCPWVTHISSLASPFPILFLTSPSLLCTTNLCLIPAPFPPFSPFPLLADNPPNEIRIYDSISVLVVCLVFVSFFRSSVDSCEFVVILLFIVLTFFFLDKSLEHFI